MTGDQYVLLSGVLTYGVPLAFAVRELVLLRRDRGDRRPPRPVVPPAPKPLPDCLIPRPLPMRQREKELA